MLRLLGILIVLFFIFQVGVSFGKHADPTTTEVIANESELDEKDQDIESFEVKHTKQLNENPKGSELFMIASFLETGLKSLFSFLFEFLHRFSLLFW
ncbi:MULTISPECIES: hypothetical protein [Allobacillus]|uniref:Uncharacterized protein n=1 Tax=Allobacillus salarius TaxID=1955272 RepID=A0A556PTN9_9BACI|nr:hypothetical protein [Allobacillus salarius]TSJ67760.1 hypothetical protein FPQ13_01460 [Allobacillus salarius]